MWLELQIFGFRALWSPYFLTFVLLVSLLYYLLTGPYRHIFGDVKKAQLNEQGMFYSGMLVLYIAQGSPVDLLAHIMMSAHMTQLISVHRVWIAFVQVSALLGLMLLRYPQIRPRGLHISRRVVHAETRVVHRACGQPTVRSRPTVVGSRAEVVSRVRFPTSCRWLSLTW